MDEREEYHLKEGDSLKVWVVSRQYNRVIIEEGTIGTLTITDDKKFFRESDAKAQHAILIAAKKKRLRAF
jgi:predicted DNA-binding WGR domain protein